MKLSLNTHRGLVLFALLGASVLSGGLSLPRLVAAEEASGKTDLTDKDLKKDYEKLQGKWQRFRKNGGLQVKLIDGNKETMQYIDVDGKLERERSVFFKLEKDGPVKLYVFANSEESLENSRECPSYLYDIVDDVFYDAPGFLHNRPTYSRTPVIYEWFKVE